MLQQNKGIPAYLDQKELPWQALSDAVVIQAVKDFRAFTRMLRRLQSKAARDHALSEEEQACLRARMDYYRGQLREIRAFFRSDHFSLYSDADGRMILCRLEREMR
ncbi:MAG: hypothetical protein PUC00_06405 [Clostridiales bacterium]|nr:hypothetical protein [Clostridiales bacterium]